MRFWSKNSIKNLNLKIKKSLGKNNKGIITVWHRGGGVKKFYRLVDFKRIFINLDYIALRIEYDPYRSSFIALVLYSNGILSYMLAFKGLKLFNRYKNTSKGPLILGNYYFLKNLPLGSLVSNIELKPGRGSILIRAAGCYGQVLSKKNGLVLIKLSSGEEYFINGACMGCLGIISNGNNKYKILGKAGISRYLNKRPHVRGVAMNPIDHPHGGGEGKTSGGRPSVDSWGNLSKGKPTRLKSLKNKFILKRRK